METFPCLIHCSHTTFELLKEDANKDDEAL